MKKALPIILIFIALTNIVGFMPLYFSVLQEIKSEVQLKLTDEAGLKNLQISGLEYNDPAVFSKTEDNEFRFRGRMYDYKTFKKTNGGYIFYALEDNKESNLIDFLKAAYSQSDNCSKNSKAPLGNLLKNFSKDFVGCSSKRIIVLLPNSAQPLFFMASDTCTGYSNVLQYPPDSNC